MGEVANTLLPEPVLAIDEITPDVACKLPDKLVAKVVVPVAVKFAAVSVPVSVGDADNTVLPVPVEVVTPVPPFATGSVPDTCVVKLTPESVPPKVKEPELVTVPDKVIPFTVPVPDTEVTVPALAFVHDGLAADPPVAST